MKYLLAKVWACLFTYFLALMPLKVSASTDLIAYVEQIPPFVYVNQGAITGGAIDILNEAGKRRDISIKYQAVPWSRAFHESLNKPNVILTGLNRTQAREDEFYWLMQLSFPKRRQSTYLWRLKSTSSQRTKSLKHGVVAMVRGDHKIQYYHDYMKSLGYTPNIYPVANREQVIHMLFKERVDYILGGELNKPLQVKALGYDASLIERGPKIPNTSQGLYIAISKKTDIEFVEQMKASLLGLTQSGRVREIMAKWHKLAINE